MKNDVCNLQGDDIQEKVKREWEKSHFPNFTSAERTPLGIPLRGADGIKKILVAYWNQDSFRTNKRKDSLVRIFSEGFVRCLVATENFFSCSKQVVSISYTMETRTLYSVGVLTSILPSFKSRCPRSFFCDTLNFLRATLQNPLTRFFFYSVFKKPILKYCIPVYTIQI